MQVYFPDDNRLSQVLGASDVVGVTQAPSPLKGLYPLETLQKNLTHSEEELFRDITKSTRSQIRQAQKDPALHRVLLTSPDDREIEHFRDFYNELARMKKTHLCTAFHVQTLKQLRNQEALVLTKIVDDSGNPLCFRIYTADGRRAMSLYSASHFRKSGDNSYKKWVGKAHRLLIWEDMLWFKEQGYAVFDSGGLTNNPNIRSFKLEFGGDIVTEYSGYLASSMKGKLVLLARRWKMSRVSGIGDS